ncbi:MAG: hypothetical protein AB2L24_18465 [Mangrovibacterium sp.]
MQKEFFDGLYHLVQRIPIRSCEVKQLIALFHLYNNVNALVSVIPCLARDYGTRQGIAKRARNIASTLAAKMEKGIGAEEEMLCLDVLIDYSNRYMDREWEDQILEQARLLLEKYIPTPGQEAGFCKLVCDCYFLVQEKELADRAKEMITHWCKQQTDTGEWTGIHPATAIKRLAVIDAYQSSTWDRTFELFRQKGTDWYLGDLPIQGTALSEEQVRLYLQKAVLLLFVNNPRAERKRIGHMGTILEQYLKESGILSPKEINPDKKDKTPLSGKDFPELALECMGILAACLFEQLGWECEEQMTSLQCKPENSEI